MAHEADVGIDAKLQMRGLFDMYRWTTEKFEAAAAVKTSEGNVGVEKDVHDSCISYFSINASVSTSRSD